MPLTVNVGLSRKDSENYNSKGASINLSAELDQSLLARPGLLQSQIQQLYSEAEHALASQAQGSIQTRGDRFQRSSSPAIARNTNPTSSSTSGSSGGGGKGTTQSQRRAINAIAKQLGLDAANEAQHEFGIDLNQMSVREASSLIEHLKSLQSQQQGGR